MNHRQYQQYVECDGRRGCTENEQLRFTALSLSRTRQVLDRNASNRVSWVCLWLLLPLAFVLQLCVVFVVRPAVGVVVVPLLLLRLQC